MVFIVLEGIDGCGKTTQAMKLAQWLRSNGKIAYMTTEPTCGKTGVFIRQILSGEEKVDPLTLALLFAADRNEHLKKEVEPALADGKIVISERYYHSTIAYQAAQGVDRDWLFRLNGFARKPDVAFLLDLEPKTGATRSEQAEIFENAEFLMKVRVEYMKLSGEMVIIDAKPPIDKVFADIKSEVARFLR